MCLTLVHLVFQSTGEAVFAQEKNDLTRDVGDMKVRLQMGAEEYRKKYLECLQLEAKLAKKSPRSVAIKEDDEGQETELVCTSSLSNIQYL